MSLRDARPLAFLLVLTSALLLSACGGQGTPTQIQEQVSPPEPTPAETEETNATNGINW